VNLHRRRLSVAAVIVLTGLISQLAGMAGASASTSSPPADPQAVGSITLCAQNGQQITSGSLTTKPAVWRAIGATAAPKEYAKNGTATLLAFQPRPGVVPGEWSGEQLTGSGLYSNPGHPIATATVIDESLATYLRDYPLSAAGLIQLRIYLGAPNVPAYTLLYDATYLRVKNGSWTQLDPGPADCGTAGKSISDETLTLPKKDFKTKTAKDAADPSGSATANPSSGSSTPGPAANNGSSGGGGKTAQAGGASLASDSSSTSHASRNIAIVVAVALLVGLAATFARRRRS
jgi:hypothetical protein